MKSNTLKSLIESTFAQNQSFNLNQINIALRQ